jgi:hypothetical protein
MDLRVLPDSSYGAALHVNFLSRHRSFPAGLEIIVSFRKPLSGGSKNLVLKGILMSPTGSRLRTNVSAESSTIRGKMNGIGLNWHSSSVRTSAWRSIERRHSLYRC